MRAMITVYDDGTTTTRSASGETTAEHRGH
jgi:hypothetical protein